MTSKTLSFILALRLLLHSGNMKFSGICDFSDEKGYANLQSVEKELKLKKKKSIKASERKVVQQGMSILMIRKKKGTDNRQIYQQNTTTI